MRPLPALEIALTLEHRGHVVFLNGDARQATLRIPTLSSALRLLPGLRQLKGFLPRGPRLQVIIGGRKIPKWVTRWLA